MCFKVQKYKDNLKVSTTAIFSYNTKVAEINHGARIITVSKKYSPTTSKHINYVCEQFNKKVTSFMWKVVYTKSFYDSAYMSYRERFGQSN